MSESKPSSWKHILSNWLTSAGALAQNYIPKWLVAAVAIILLITFGFKIFLSAPSESVELANHIGFWVLALMVVAGFFALEFFDRRAAFIKEQKELENTRQRDRESHEQALLQQQRKETNLLQWQSNTLLRLTEIVKKKTTSENGKTQTEEVDTASWEKIWQEFKIILTQNPPSK